MSNAEITGIILSGGKGERLGGCDKGLYEYQGAPLIQHCIEILKPQVNSLIISCNRNLDEYSSYGCELVSDRRVNYQGPLAGLEAALGRCQTKYALIWPVDSQPVPANLAATLFAELMQSKSDIVHLHQTHKPQYLVALLKSSLQPSLTDYLNSRQRTVRDWYALHRVLAIDRFQENQIRNLNTAEDFQASSESHGGE